MVDFPNQVNAQQAPSVAGDFASANPRRTVLAGEGGLIAGTGVIAGLSVPGAVVGRFGWLTFQSVDNDNAPATLNTFGTGLPAGLVSREQVGLITTYLASGVQYRNTGFQLAAFSEVDMWVVNASTVASVLNQKVFANYADGSATFGAAGGSIASGTSTTSTIAPGTMSVTGSITGDVFTAASGLTGNIYPGEIISGTNVATGTAIVAQVTPLLTGEALNGLGRYTVTIPEQTVASTAISGTYGTLTVSGTITGTWGVGQTVTGGTTSAGTVITALLTGAGGAGTYVVNNTQTVTSAALASQSAIETKWYVRSVGAVGELVKISSQA